ncbi:MAG: reverse transcriptase domain-containing protein [Sedimenticola sp.]
MMAKIMQDIRYDILEAEFLVQGFTHGFSLNYQGPRQPRESRNLNSAITRPEVVRQKLSKEIVAGRVAGPFPSRPLPDLRVSPIGLVPKKVPGEYRLIHHLSHPKGESVNDFIDPKLCSVQYTSFDEAIYMLQDLGQHCNLFKIDLRNAFRLLPVRPEDFDLLGFKFDIYYFIDKCVPFGCSISCSLFERFATFVEFYVKSCMSSGSLIHYLDDFLGGDRTDEACAQAMAIFKDCAAKLNIPLADEKSAGPTEIISYLGMELDSAKMVVRIPQEKLTDLVSKIENILGKPKSTLHDVQSLIGSLNFCCRVIVVGRPFCRRLIDATCGLTKPYHHIRLNNGIKLDLYMWLDLLRNYNGISVFHDRYWVSNIEAQLFTDSAGGRGRGFGAYFQGHWFTGMWPDSWHDKGYTTDIAMLELFPIFISLVVWGEQLRNKKIVFHCDNMAVVYILNTMSAKSELVMYIVRKLALFAFHSNIVVKAVHVEGIRNVICDALSRFQWDKFRELAPDADKEPYVVPSYLWNIFDAGPGVS